MRINSCPDTFTLWKSFLVMRLKSFCMPMEVQEQSNAKERFQAVKADVPESISVVPIGLEEYDSEEFVVLPDDSDTIEKLLREAGVDFENLSIDEDTSTLVLHSEELILPTLYLAYRFTKNNWGQIEYALDKISEYYTRRFDQEIKLSVEQETADGDTVRLTYRGPPHKVNEVRDEISNIVDIEMEVDDEQER